MHRIYVLLLKERQQHLIALGILFILTAIGFGIQLLNVRIASRTLSLLVTEGWFLIFFVPLASMVLAHRLVVKEYQGRTQLFIEALPIHRVEMLLVKNEEYCAPDYMHGHFDRILIKIIPSVSDQMLLLKKGDIDIAPELPPKEALSLMDEPGVKVLSFQSQRRFSMGLNYKVEPFDDVKVRQALAYAVPYADIIDTVYLGQAQKPAGTITKGTSGATDKYWVYDYDADKAKELLAEAGYPDGFEMDLVIDLSEPMREDTAVLIKDAFGKIGVQVNVIKESPAAFREKLRDRRQPAYLDVDHSWTNDAGYTADMIFTSEGFGNYADFSNPEFDEIIANAWTILGPDRMAEYDRAQEILDSELPVIVIAQPNLLVAMRDDIGGYCRNVDEMPRFHELYRVEQ